MTLHLAGRDFPIRSAVLTASVADPYWCDLYNGGRGEGLTWHLHVEAGPVLVGDESWEPSLSHDFSLGAAVPGWAALTGVLLEWAEPFDERTGEPNGCFYLFEHEDMPSGRIRFGRRVGPAFELSWSGTCNPHHSPDLDEDVPFELSCTVVFEGVTVRGSAGDDAEHLTARLAEHLVLDGLVPCEIVLGSAYESGVGMKSRRFVPRRE